MTDTKQRAAFEAWCFNDGPSSANLNTARNALGDYIDERTDGAWHGWQSALSQAAPDVATELPKHWKDRVSAYSVRYMTSDATNAMQGEIADLRAALASRDKDAEITDTDIMQLAKGINFTTQEERHFYEDTYMKTVDQPHEIIKFARRVLTMAKERG